MRPVPPVPEARHGVFTAAEAVAHGWSRAALDRAVHAGTLWRPERGLYVARSSETDPASTRERFAAASVAAVLAVGPAVASHRSAAVLAGLPVWSVPERACITVPPRYTGDARHSHLHRASVPLTDRLDGETPRLRSARTILDIARESGVEQAAVVGDAALARGLTDFDQLIAAARRCEGWPGFRRAAELLPLLDARSESPLETISRLRLRRCALAPPEPQTEILDLAGHFVGRVDFYWDDYGVVGEVDGKEKYRGDPFDTWWRERQRHELLGDTGLVVVRWARSDLDDMPRLEARLQNAVARGLSRRSSRRWIAVPSDRFAPRITA